jgi:hypothetical protein
MKTTIDTKVWRLAYKLCHDDGVAIDIRTKVGAMVDITKHIKALLLNEIDNGQRNYDYSRTLDI